MKNRLFVPLLAVSGVLAFHSSSFAQQQGVETFDSKIILVATTNAPGASGCASIEAESDNGTTTNQMEIKTRDLPVGQYDVNVIKTSDGSTNVVDVITVTGGDDLEDSTNQWDISGTNSLGMDCTNITFSSSNSVSMSNSGTNTESDDEFALPSNIDPTDIAQVTVSDLSGNVMLVGDMSSSISNSINFNAAVQITAGPGAPNAQGVALLQNHLNRGKHKSKFLLNAVGLPPSTTLNVLVNGSVVTTINTTHSGHAKLSKLPVDLLTVQDVELQTTGGVSVATAQF